MYSRTASHVLPVNEPTQEMVEEGFAYIAECIPDRRSRIPTKLDSPAAFRSKRNAIIAKIVPMSMIPLATANGMVIMGSGKTREDCYFPLPQYLIYSGSVSLSLAVAGVIARYVLQWILLDKTVSYGESVILTVMEHAVSLLVIAQAGILFGGTLVLLPHLGQLSMRPGDEHYCDGQLVMFTLVFLSLCWFFMLFALACFLYIQCVSYDLSNVMYAEMLRKLNNQKRLYGSSLGEVESTRIEKAGMFYKKQEDDDGLKHKKIRNAKASSDINDQQITAIIDEFKRYKSLDALIENLHRGKK